MLHIFKSEEEVLDSLAVHFANLAEKSIIKNGKFSVVLSGGQSPKKLYHLLASTFKNKIDWSNVYFFFGDERNVPHTDSESNFLMAQISLFEPLKIKKSNIFSIDTKLKPKEAALKYLKDIEFFFDKEALKFDFILLGIGNDSHTASIFPYTPIIQDSVPSIKDVYIKEQQVFRISMNAPLMNQARHIAFLVYGESKAVAVNHVLEDKINTEIYPAQLIKPINGEIHWFLDRQAASLLTHL